jgi:lipoprotein-releasing system ATP-binding protein
MIKGKNIHKYYDNLHVLKGVNINVKKGEIVSIVGASGAGKTTLLQILGTLDKASKTDSYSLKINDIEIKSLSDRALAKFRNEHIGFIFQFHQLLPEFTASHRCDHKPSELSGGEQQRVAVARALVNNPDLIFADEPSGNLDSESAENLHNLFFKLRDEFGQTFVIVTHNEDLANMADRKLVMVDGNIRN